MLEVPSSPKLYTTTYDNFKGVDLTNDPSNIWKYRMAEGLNLAPDEAGQPWKRTGWEVAIEKTAFMSAFNECTGRTASDISIQRTYYFELKGVDHMACIADVRYYITSQGTRSYYDLNGCVFIVRKDILTAYPSGEVIGDYDNVVMLRTNEVEDPTNTTPSVENALQVFTNRCFFFEGNGTAGFYMFKQSVIDHQTPENSEFNVIYIYTNDSWTVGLQDVEGFRAKQVEPYIPTIIIARSPGGGDGTLLDGVNMLTDYRRVRFYGDGNSTNYRLPTTAKTNTLSVKIMNEEGTWEELPATVTEGGQTVTNWTPYMQGSSIIGVTFSSDKKPSTSPITGEDNVEITYESTGRIVTSNTSADTVVCSTPRQAYKVESQSRNGTETYTYSGTPTYRVSNRRNGIYKDPGGVAYARVEFTVVASASNASTLTNSTTGNYGTPETTTYEPSGSATGLKTVDPSAELVYLKSDGAGGWTAMDTSEYSASFQSFSNTLALTLNDISEWDATAVSQESDSLEYKVYGADTNNRSSETYSSTVVIVRTNKSDTDQEARASAESLSFSDAEVIAYARGLGGDPVATTSGGGTAHCRCSKSNDVSVLTAGTVTKNYTEYKETTTTAVYKYNIKLSATTVTVDTDDVTLGASVDAFMKCSRATLFGSGLLNAVFMSGSSSPAYTSRVWYSGVGDPTYFPDTNYIEAGSNDTNIMGMIRVGEYLGIIKQGKNIDATIYLAYPTSYDDNTTYAIKQSITGVGAVSNGAFNILSDESLFLSSDGIMAITPDDEERQIKNRSYFINKPLTEEEYLSSAVSFVYDGMYILCVPRMVGEVMTGVCYVLDGSQKTSWANEKTNLQFEAYFWDNIPAKCFAQYNGELWFADYKGNMCKFKPVDHSDSYHDDYSATNTKCVSWENPDLEIEFDQATYEQHYTGTYDFMFNGTAWKRYSSVVTNCSCKTYTFVKMVKAAGTYTFTYNNGWYHNGQPVDLNDYGVKPTGTSTITVEIIEHSGTLYGINITDGEPEPWDIIEVMSGVPIKARFATISDNDGATQYFKNMQKKGVVVSLLPKKETGATIYVKADEKDAIKTTIVKGQISQLPSDVFLKKKIKKYKRLQFVVENNNYDETFGVDSITKTYTIGNFAKNRRQ